MLKEFGLRLNTAIRTLVQQAQRQIEHGREGNPSQLRKKQPAKRSTRQKSRTQIAMAKRNSQILTSAKPSCWRPKNRIDHTGANTQSGGLNPGLTSGRYWPSIPIAVAKKLTPNSKGGGGEQKCHQAEHTLAAVG